jgi:hypothetical protein
MYYLHTSLDQLYQTRLFNVRFSINRQAIRYIHSAIKDFQLHPELFQHLILPRMLLKNNKENLPELKFNNPKVNDQQKLAIQQIIKRCTSKTLFSNPYSIIGPPGTNNSHNLFQWLLLQY